MAKKKAKPDFSKPKDIPAAEQEQTLPKEAVDYEYEGLPTLVIAGRPNVGKSTLFNRFLQKRVAIVNPTPGVTRDPVEATAILKNKPVHLIDTGGYKLQRDIGTMEAELDELVVGKSLDEIDKADCILILLEAGVITGED